jgi:hypothetical protein
VSRWRGCSGGLTIAIAALVLLAAGPAQAEPSPALLVSTLDGSSLAVMRLPADGRFALSYRNSLYGSLVDEAFVVTPQGELRLTGVAADELAVLEEYYRAAERATRQAAGASRAWRIKPPIPVEEALLIVAATDLGRRTLLVDGAPPVELWRLVDDREPWVSIQPAR